MAFGCFCLAPVDAIYLTLRYGAIKFGVLAYPASTK